MLGFETLDCPIELFGNLDHDVIRAFDAFTDNPIPGLYRELDARHPGAKFVHTVRDEASWLLSVHWLFSVGAVKFAWQEHPIFDQMHQALYGRTTFDEAVFAEARTRHDREVREYFADRPGDLLVFDLFAGDGFEKLAPFLGKELPKRLFPHRNQQQSRLRVALGAVRRRLFPPPRGG